MTSPDKVNRLKSLMSARFLYQRLSATISGQLASAVFWIPRESNSRRKLNKLGAAEIRLALSSYCDSLGELTRRGG